MVFVLLYIHTDCPEYSDVLGVFSDKSEAVKDLLECANYREKNGKLTQYKEPCSEYSSLGSLSEVVDEKMELVDVDIYRIVELSDNYLVTK